MLASLAVLPACAKELPPPTVDAFMRDEMLLESTLFRCSDNRSEMRYEPECVNVRQAVSIIAAREERARRQQLEAQSMRKREALRRTQAAVAEARRRAAEDRWRSDDGDVIVTFEELPPGSETVVDGVVPEGATIIPIIEGSSHDAPASEEFGIMQSTTAPVNASPADDLRSVREELQRRSEDDGN